jgi:hypothetical protein
MGATLEAVKSVVKGLSDDSLLDLHKFVDGILRAKGMRGSAGDLSAAMAKGEGVKKGPTEWWRRITGIDIDKLREGKGFYALEGEWLKDGQDKTSGLVLSKTKDGKFYLYVEGKLAIPDGHDFGPSFEKVKTHPYVWMLWRIALMFEDRETLEN